MFQLADNKKVHPIDTGYGMELQTIAPSSFRI